MFKYQIIQLAGCQLIGFPALGRLREKLMGDLISEDTEDNNALRMLASLALLSIGLVRHLLRGNWKALCLNITKHHPNAP